MCAAIPVIKLLREALVGANVHRMLGIVNGTTNFILTRMEAGADYDEALAEAQRLGYAEADPTDDVCGADAAAKMAILATVAFGARVPIDDVSHSGIDTVTPLHVAAARELEMVVRLVGAATLIDGRYDVRVQPVFVDRHHPLAAVEGAVQRGDAAGRRDPRDHARRARRRRDGDGLGGRGRHGQRDRHDRHRLPPERRVLAHARAAAARRRCARRSTSTSRSTTGPACSRVVAQRLAGQQVSIARLVQQPHAEGASLHIVLHEAPVGAIEAALAEIAALPETRQAPVAIPVISDRGVTELGWA